MPRLLPIWIFLIGMGWFRRNGPSRIAPSVEKEVVGIDFFLAEKCFDFSLIE
jgi:hypothetical protein